MLQALGEVLEVPEGERAIVGPSDAGRVVVLCDTYERLVPLRNLSPEDSRQYFHACGVDPARHDQLIELAHGTRWGCRCWPMCWFAAARRPNR